MVTHIINWWSDVLESIMSSWLLLKNMHDDKRKKNKEKWRRIKLMKMKVMQRFTGTMSVITMIMNCENTEVILTLYLALVRSHLDYAMKVLPLRVYHRMDIDSISRERRMTKIIQEPRHFTVQELIRTTQFALLWKESVLGYLTEVYI